MSEPLPELVVRIAGVAEVGDPPVLVASVAEDLDGSGFRLEFQRASVFNAQDRRTGMDTYCICTGEGATHYGGVERIEADEHGVIIALDALAAAQLHVPDTFRIRLEVAPEDKAVFVDGLHRVVEGPPAG